jgi:hypothetical protein
MAVAALKQKPQLKTFYATVHVTRERPGPDRRPNCDVGYDYVTLTRGATALAVVASTFAVATSFPSKPPALNAMGGLRYGRCHGKPAAAYGQ